jgi:hypothetical protein
MPLTNAQIQKRWRDKRNTLASALEYGSDPEWAADGILLAFGPEEAGRVLRKAEKVVRALRKRLRNLKPDCPACQGKGFAPAHVSTACGMPLWDTDTASCHCDGTLDPPTAPAPAGSSTSPARPAPRPSPPRSP